MTGHLLTGYCTNPPVLCLSKHTSQKGQARVYDGANEKDNTRSLVDFIRHPYPAHARAQLKDEQNEIQDTEDQYE